MQERLEPEGVRYIDQRLQLRIGGGVDALSRTITADDVSEALLASVIRRLNELGRNPSR